MFTHYFFVLLILTGDQFPRYLQEYQRDQQPNHHFFVRKKKRQKASIRSKVTNLMDNLREI